MHLAKRPLRCFSFRPCERLGFLYGGGWGVFVVHIQAFFGADFGAKAAADAAHALYRPRSYGFINGYRAGGAFFGADAAIDALG